MHYTQHHVQTRRLLFAVLVLSVLIIGFGSNVRAQQEPVVNVYVLDHFKCYKTEGQPINDLVFLRDQFGVQDKTFERDIVGNPRIFCNPTRKIHPIAGAVVSVGISNVNNHLTWYDIKPALGGTFQPRQVSVTNQFAPNGQTLIVISPKFLAVPTQKVAVDGKPTEQGAPQDLDHFKCYRVEGAPLIGQSAQLFDQFSPPNSWDSFKILRAMYLCNPVAKAHFLGWNEETGQANFSTATIQHPNDHLMCYSLQPMNPALHNLTLNNQFGTGQQLLTTQAHLLCVPSSKRVLQPGTNPADNT